MTQETEVLDAQELAALLAQPNRDTATGCRNYAMLQLMAQTGIRCNEAVQVEEKDIREEMWGDNGDRTKIIVLRLRKKTTKGKKDRIGIPLVPKTLSALKNWQVKRAELGINGGPLFCTISQGNVGVPVSRGENGGDFVSGDVELIPIWRGGRLGGRYIRRMVARYAQKAGLERRVHPHMLRHSALTNLYEETKDLRLVQTVAGHSNSHVTERYAYVRPMNIARAFGVG